MKDYDVIDAFIGYLQKHGYSELRIDRYPDKENRTSSGAFQRIMMECKFNSYSVNPTSAYPTLTALLETARWRARGNDAGLRT